jgi:hypothetical protein
MKSFSFGILSLAMALGAGLAAQGGTPTLPDAAPNTAVIKGCVDRATADEALPQSELVWTYGDLTLRRATGVSGLPVAGSSGHGPYVYWLDNAGGLAQHVGQFVEVSGPLSDFDEGDVTVDRVTEITLDLGQTTETKRVPASWLRPITAAPVNDADYEIRVRRVHVDSIRVLGACNLPEPESVDRSDS